MFVFLKKKKPLPLRLLEIWARSWKPYPDRAVRGDADRLDEKKARIVDNLLETCGLTKRFGRGSSAQTAVDAASLHVRAGEVYGLLGPNGAGKSTMLKMLTGMLRPTEGQIVFDGHPWRREDLYEIGSLIETPPLYANLTARENLRVRTELLGVAPPASMRCCSWSTCAIRAPSGGSVQPRHEAALGYRVGPGGQPASAYPR